MFQSFLTLEQGYLTKIFILKTYFLWVLESLSRSPINDEDIWDLFQFHEDSLSFILYIVDLALSQ
jgi:hypothetical protein